MSDIIQMNRTPEGKSEMQVLNPEKLQTALTRLQSTADMSENVNITFQNKMKDLSGKRYSGAFAEEASRINQSLEQAINGRTDDLARELWVITKQAVNKGLAQETANADSRIQNKAAEAAKLAQQQEAQKKAAEAAKLAQQQASKDAEAANRSTAFLNGVKNVILWTTGWPTVRDAPKK